MGITANIRPGPRSAFIVNVDGHMLAQKTAAGFPDEDEVVALLQALRAP